MALVINTNVDSLIAQQNLSSTNSQLRVSVQRISSGYRVNSSADDAAGLARADQLKSQSRMIQASMRNVNDAISALEVSDKAAEQITNLLSRMGELSASAAQGTLDDTTRAYYSDEYDKLKLEIDRIANTTEFGGYKLINGSESSLTMFIGFKNSSNDVLEVSLENLLSGGSGVQHQVKSVLGFNVLSIPAAGDISINISGSDYTFSVGAGTSTYASLVANINANADLNAWAEYDTASGSYKLVIQAANAGSTINIVGDSTSLDLDNDTLAAGVTNTYAPSSATGLGIVAGVLGTREGAQSAIDTISTALQRINDARAVYGASTNRLSAAIFNLQVTFTNYQSAESRIRDADFAYETSVYTKNQIMVQAGTSVLAQANTLPQNALTLLR